MLRLVFPEQFLSLCSGFGTAMKRNSPTHARGTAPNLPILCQGHSTKPASGVLSLSTACLREECPGPILCHHHHRNWLFGYLCC